MLRMEGLAILLGYLFRKGYMKRILPIAIIEKDLKKRQKAIRAHMQKTAGQTLILVPEVAMLDAYADMGVVYHAGLKQSEKKNIRARVVSGEVRVVVGTQKALFLPFQQLSLVVIDEEQYESYKLWSQYPRLHTVRGALELARVWGAHVIYGSSYPSLRLRHLCAEGMCKKVIDNPVTLSVELQQFSFEDRKWKRALPNDIGSKIRSWARGGKRILVIHNKKDHARIQEVLFFHLSAKAKKNIILGTTALLSDAVSTTYDHVVWVFPELTMHAIDHRSNERARMLASRMQLLAPAKPIYVVTRSMNMAHDVLMLDDGAWQTKALEERKRLSLPPFTDVVRLTVRDKSKTKARTRATDVIQILTTSLPAKSGAQVFGPFQDRAGKATDVHEYHALAVGQLSVLLEAYKNVPIDAADVDPHRIV